MTDIKADPTGSSQARIRDQVAAIHFVMKHPIAGAGIGMDILALNEERGPRWSMVHNAYFQYAVDLGLPGFILFLFLQWNVFRAVRSARRLAAPVPALRDLSYLAEGLEVSLIVFAVAALFHPVAYNFFFYYIAGLALAARSAARSAVNGAVSAADSQPFLLRVNADSRLARQTA
jgi:O-antigen ligase